MEWKYRFIISLQVADLELLPPLQILPCMLFLCASEQSLHRAETKYLKLNHRNSWMLNGRLKINHELLIIID